MAIERELISRRRWLKSASVCAAGLGAARWGLVPLSTQVVAEQAAAPGGGYVPPPESEGGWRVGDPDQLGVNADRLRDAVGYHDTSPVTTSHGGALVIIYKGHLIHESYVTGTEGGPERWTAQSCNDMKSSTKSVFGTAVGVFLDEYKDRVSLDSYLVGTSREDSLISQIWDQPLTDTRKTRIKVKHAISMTSGHESREPWVPTRRRHRYPEYAGPFQMYEYCFGWWHFDGIPDHHTLMFEPGSDFNYSNYGLEQTALAMRNVSGEEVGPLHLRSRPRADRHATRHPRQPVPGHAIRRRSGAELLRRGRVGPRRQRGMRCVRRRQECEPRRLQLDRRQHVSMHGPRLRPVGLPLAEPGALGEPAARARGVAERGDTSIRARRREYPESLRLHILGQR